MVKHCINTISKTNTMYVNSFKPDLSRLVYSLIYSVPIMRWLMA